MAKKILVLQGSARKGMNTATLAQSFCKGAEEAGNQVTFIEISGMNINGCKDCKHCFSHEGVCFQKDDMTEIYEHLRTHDVLVIATPVYFFGMTSQIKAPLDRMYAGLGKPFNISAMALLATVQDSDESIIQPMVDQFKVMTGYCKYDNLGVVYAGGLNEDRVDIQAHPALEKAYKLGKSIG